MILVTGGAGFIGSHIVDALLDQGEDVRVLDALLEAAHRERPDYLDPRAEFVEGDVRDPDTIARAVAGADAVCHQSAMVGLGVDLGDIADYVSHNDLGTAMLLRALAARRFAGTLVLASSMVVYGEGRYRCAEHGLVRPGPRRAADLDAGQFEPPCPVCGRPLDPESVPEDAPLDPRNVYAATKVAQEHLCTAFARETGATVTALRYHNVYGPRMPRDTPYAGVASIFRSSLAAGKAPRVFEDGAQRRDFVARPRRRRRQRPRARGRRPGRVQRRLRHAAQRGGHGGRAGPRRRPDARAGRHRPVARGRRPPRLRLPGPRERRARLHRHRGLRGGHARVRRGEAARVTPRRAGLRRT